MTIHEPMTLATDCLLALLAAVLAVKLRRRANHDQRAQIWLARALGLLAVSAFVGGTFHGFVQLIDSDYWLYWWGLTLVTIHLVSAALGLSLLHASAQTANGRDFTRPRLIRNVRVLIAAKLVAFAIVAACVPMFLVPVIDYGSTMLAWLIAAFVMRAAWSRWMIAAIAISFAAAVVQQAGWAPAKHFNHNDLYHIIQGLGVLAFYQAGLRLRVPAGSVDPR